MLIFILGNGGVFVGQCYILQGKRSNLNYFFCREVMFLQSKMLLLLGNYVNFYGGKCLFLHQLVLIVTGENVYFNKNNSQEFFLNFYREVA
jgi:hypothetical protein